LDFNVQNKFEQLLSLEPYSIINELEKLSLVINNNVVEEKDLEICKNSLNETNIFNLVKYILLNKKDNALKLYETLLSQKYQPTDLIQVMATQIFNLKCFKMALIQNYSTNEITNTLKMSPYQQKINLPLISKIPLSYLNDLLNDMYDLDYNIKHNSLIPDIALKTFISK